MKVCDIRRADVIALLEQIAVNRESPVMANRTQALLSMIFNFALEREIVDASPCVNLPRKHKEKAKDRVLAADEIKTFMLALKEENKQLAAYFHVLLLTGQRPGEVQAMKWAEIEGDTWTIPAERAKNGRSHRIPLSPQVKEILSEIKEANKAAKEKCCSGDVSVFDTYCFPSIRAAHIRPRTVQNAIHRIRERVPLEPFTAHDFRRTAATNMRRLGASRETVAKILNHKSAEGPVTGIYDRYDEWPEMRNAMVKWGEEFNGTMSKTLPSRVVSITARSARMKAAV